jgi:uncharacterized protein (UPF0276 family)
MRMASSMHRAHRTRPLSGHAGAALKGSHAPQILEGNVAADWFEVHAENYMVDGGPRLDFLEKFRSKFDLTVHGVAASLGGEGPPCTEHLQRLKAVVDRFEPFLVSEHLAWSTHAGVFYNDLLPTSYDSGTLRRVASHVDILQETLGRQVLIENPSTYVRFGGQDYSEAGFLAELVRRTGCGLLLDVNNVFVSAANGGFDAAASLATYPLHTVQQIHIAGHAQDDATEGALLIDSHNRPVDDAVWALLDQALAITGPLPVLVEWDDPVPEWEVLEREVLRARAVLDNLERVEKRQAMS